MKPLFVATLWVAFLASGGLAQETEDRKEPQRSILYWETGDALANESGALDVRQFRMAVLEIREKRGSLSTGVFTEIYAPPNHLHRGSGTFVIDESGEPCFLELSPGTGRTLRMPVASRVTSIYGELWKGTLRGGAESNSGYHPSFYWYPDMDPGVATSVFPGILLDDAPQRFANRIKPEERYVQNLRVDRYTVENGLNHDTVRTISQSGDGHMWFGSFGGLHRFDGREFKVFFTHQNVRSVVCDSADEVERLAFVSAEGDLYDLTLPIRGDERPLLNVVDFGVDEDLRDLLIDPNGDLWVLSDNSLFSVAKRTNSSFADLDVSAVFNKSSQEARQFVALSPERFLVVGFGGARELGFDASGNLRLNQWTPSPMFMRTVDTRVGPFGELEIVTSHPLGIVRDARGGAWRWYDVPPTTFVCWAEDGGVLGGYRNEIWKMTPSSAGSTLERFRVAGEEQLVKDVYQASDGAIWFILQNEGVGRLETYRGVNYVRGPFERNSPPGGGSALRSIERTYGVVIDEDGVEWIAGGVGLLRRENQEYRALNLDEDIHHLAAHLVTLGRGEREGEIWFALDTASGSGSIVDDLPPEKLASLPVLGKVDDLGRLVVMQRRGVDVAFAKAQQLLDTGASGLLLSTDAGLFRSKDGGITRIGARIPSGMARVDDSLVWVAMENEDSPKSVSNSGVILMDVEQGRALLSYPDPPQEFASDPEAGSRLEILANPSRSLTLDGDGHLWVAGDRGFRVIQRSSDGVWGELGSGSWTMPERAEFNRGEWDWLRSGISDIQVSGEHVCFLTSVGLYIAKKATVINAVREGRFDFRAYRFDRADGIESSLTASGRWPLMATGMDGRVLVSLGKAITDFSPSTIVESLVPPRLVLRGIGYIDEEGIRHFVGEDSIRDGVYPFPAKSGKSVFAEFSSLAFRAPDRIQYASELDGAGTSEDFSNASAASFYELKPGLHALKVSARSHNGSQMDRPLEVYFRIEPSTFERPLFKFGFGVLVVSLAFGCGRFVMTFGMRHQELERQRRFDEERSRISRDIHDEVGTALAQIRMLAGSRLGSDVGEVPPPWERRRRRISDLASLASQTVRDVIWTFNPDKSRLEHLSEYLFSYVETAFSGTGVSLEFSVERDVALDEDLSSKVKYELLLMTKGIVSNVLRHAGATRFWMRLGRSNSGGVTIDYGDDGCGFDPNLVAESDGISGLKRRAEAMGVQMGLDSKPGGGTRYHLSLDRGLRDDT